MERVGGGLAMGERGRDDELEKAWKKHKETDENLSKLTWNSVTWSSFHLGWTELCGAGIIGDTRQLG